MKREQGTTVPGAEVVLTQELTGVKLATRTEASGDFVFPSVLPGRYSVAVGAQGFKRLEKTGIVLTSSERLSVRALSLEVGSLSESITVNGVDTSARFDAAGKLVNVRLGQITGARAPRTQQLALRLSF